MTHTIALVGNPNVGKSTLFNALTHSNQHTGNWAGKTVSVAQGQCHSGCYDYTLVDLPGTYSLLPHSAEEEVTRQFLCTEAPQAVMVVCDATCLERNLNLVLQTLEICPRVLVCVNLLDEAKRKRIQVHLDILAHRLGVPVVGVVARQSRSLSALLTALDALMEQSPTPHLPHYPPEVEEAILAIQPLLPVSPPYGLSHRFLALQLLEGESLLPLHPLLSRCIAQQQRWLAEQHCILSDTITETLIHTAERIAQEAVEYHRVDYQERDRRLDRLFTSRWTGFPLLLLLLGFIFWLTIRVANTPSQWLSQLFATMEPCLARWLSPCPLWIQEALLDGVWEVSTQVISVMLPPMLIFFPLFSLLEDVGYLPRIAYNLDRPFQCCHACGKQALTMCMGFGCNAVGVTGCRIIDSPRERLLAMLTNCLVPCNGRFPTLILLLTLFFSQNSLLCAVQLTGVIVLGIGLTFLLTRLLSATVLRGEPAPFTLELPPYRRPQIGQVLRDSLLNRSIFVLGRAVCVAAPAGLLLWVLSHITLGGTPILQGIAIFLDPFAQLLGLDGWILLAFCLGFPANELVFPLLLMLYQGQGNLVELGAFSEIHALLSAHGWTQTTALCMVLFSLCHFPCSTTLLTIRKETQSWRWTALAFCCPTLLGMVLCGGVNLLLSLCGG